MKAFAIFWILFALVACSSLPREYPTCDIPGPAPEVGQALGVPEFPVEVGSTEASATYDRAGLLQLRRVQEAGFFNAKIARENALALEARNDEVRALIECSRFQNVWIELQAEALRDETREHYFDNLLYRMAILLIAAASIL